MNKNLTMRMGNCNHRAYIPELLEVIRAGAVDPTPLITNLEPMTNALPPPSSRRSPARSP